MTYYIKGGSRYNEANPTVWTALNLAGFLDTKYLDASWKQIDYEGIIDSQDPFWLFGSISGGAKEVEIGLYNDRRIKIDTTGVFIWDGDSWEDPLTVGGGGKDNLYELDDVVISGTPADNELLAYDTSTSKWINQTGTQAGLSLSGHTHTQLHDRSHTYDSALDHSGTLSWTNVSKTGSNLTDLATRQHAGLTDITTDQHHNQSHALNSHTQGSNVIFMAKGAVFTEIGLGGAGTVLVSGGEGEDLIWESHYTQSEVDGLLHPQSHTLASHSSEAHNELTGYNDETDVKHLTDAQLGDLHSIYTLEQHDNNFHSTNYEAANANIQSHVASPVSDAHHTLYSLESHNNTYHSTNYHTETDGTGAVTVHSGITDAGSGIIISTGERDALHTIVVAGDLNHNDLANIDADDIKHITATQLGALHAIYTLEVHDNTEHDPDYADETRVFEKGSTFPVSPAEGDLHYDTVDEALFRYSGDAQAWLQIGGAGVGSNTALTLEQARTNSNQIAGEIDMNQNMIIDLPAPTADTDASNRKHARHGIASDDLVFSNDTEQYTVNDLWIKAKEIIIYKSAKLRVYWEMKVNNSAYTGKSKIYINGVAVGAEKSSTSDVYLPYTEDVEVNNGDLLQIYSYISLILERCYTQNMRLKFIEYVSNDP